MAQSASDNPSFVCTSGKILWGQLHCIAEGYLANNSDSESPSPSVRGTIIQHDFNYKVNAARGEWNVKDILYRSQPEDEPSIAGFVVFNKKTANPVEVLNDCMKLGMRSSPDKRIIYVNRYDWGWAHEIPPASEQLLYDANLTDDAERKLRAMLGQRIILVDASVGLFVINQLKESSSNLPKNVLIKDTLSVQDNAIGVHLACPNTEYELGWMVFNPANTEELIAFVYDGSYTGLEGDITLRN